MRKRRQAPRRTEAGEVEAAAVVSAVVVVVSAAGAEVPAVAAEVCATSFPLHPVMRSAASTRPVILSLLFVIVTSSFLKSFLYITPHRE